MHRAEAVLQPKTNNTAPYKRCCEGRVHTFFKDFVRGKVLVRFFYALMGKGKKIWLFPGRNGEVSEPEKVLGYSTHSSMVTAITFIHCT